ncbi:hypothetical protein HHK36_032424 [Tetracentron sinense]|uniref:Uncharacterized protein n=1 Tax=Tetracentron sinense TaxID=13715 RepID=A0A835CXL2_TETSI|nr:hypothetical protein HHK36_032424 [Tetracentron sinense]
MTFRTTKTQAQRQTLRKKEGSQVCSYILIWVSERSLVSAIWAVGFFHFCLSLNCSIVVLIDFRFCEDINKRRFQRSTDFKDIEKPFQIPIQDRSSNCKFSSLKLVLVIIICGTFLTILQSPAVYNNDHLSHSGFRSSFVERWIGERPVTDPRYVSHSDVNWDQISNIIKKLNDGNEYQGIGLLNFNDSEIDNWRQLIQSAKHIVLHLDYARNNVTWNPYTPNG